MTDILTNSEPIVTYCLVVETSVISTNNNPFQYYSYPDCNGRCGGSMVGALGSGLRGLGSRPGWVIVLCSWAIHFTFAFPLPTQEYICVSVDGQGGLMNCWGNLVLVRLPIQWGLITLHLHISSSHPGVYMCICRLSGSLMNCWGNLVFMWLPIQWELVIYPVTL